VGINSESDCIRPGASDEAGAREANDRSDWSVWVGRVGEAEPAPDVAHLTPSQRIALCWEISKQAWLLSGGELDESTFRRDVEVLRRRAAKG
jgi:hypothetical protein